jgi:hypothetical protein
MSLIYLNAPVKRWWRKWLDRVVVGVILLMVGWFSVFLVNLTHEGGHLAVFNREGVSSEPDELLYKNRRMETVKVSLMLKAWDFKRR